MDQAGQPAAPLPLLVVALGGNALLKRGEPLDAAVLLGNVRLAARQLAQLAQRFRLVVTHGNGPQVGLLALQNAAYPGVPPYPLDMLDAQTEGLIGYLIEQELANLLPGGPPVATLLTRVEVDPADPAFQHPSKPIGPVYTVDESEALARGCAWRFMADGPGMRRTVASPAPMRFIGLAGVRALLHSGSIVVCAGGGGIPVTRRSDGAMEGVEAVIDKDAVSSLLARELDAHQLVIATDVAGIYLDWGQPTQRLLRAASPTALRALRFAQGSMAPKVEAACAFAEATGRAALICSLEGIAAQAGGADASSGTLVDRSVTGVF